MRSTFDPTGNLVRSIQVNGQMTALLLSRQEWQREALAMTQRQRSPHTAGEMTKIKPARFGIARLITGTGGRFIRISRFLRSTAAPAREHA